jgi:hypothetical protein
VSRRPTLLLRLVQAFWPPDPRLVPVVPPIIVVDLTGAPADYRAAMVARADMAKGGVQ